jgi:hypothetical protein
VMIVLVPAAIMLVLWRGTPEGTVAKRWFAAGRAGNRRPPECPASR